MTALEQVILILTKDVIQYDMKHKTRILISENNTNRTKELP